MTEMGLSFDDASDAGTSGQRKKLILLAAVAVLLLVLGVILVPTLVGGGSEPSATPPGSSAQKSGAATKASGTQAKKKSKPAAQPVKKPKPFNAAVARDPFKPYYTPSDEQEKAEEDAPGAPAASATPPTTTGTGDFTLVDVKTVGSSSTVTVLYQRVSYPNLEVGKSFADGKFTVSSAVGKCASFTYGEVPFALCEGQTQKIAGV